MIIILVMYEFFCSRANIRYCWDSRFLLRFLYYRVRASPTDIVTVNSIPSP